MIEPMYNDVLPEERWEELELFIITTEEAWRNAGLIKKNSFGVEIIIATGSTRNFDTFVRFECGSSLDGATHDREWYIENAHGKNKICIATGLDSLTAVRLHPGATAHLEGAFPWGGAVIDAYYGIIVGTSGFREEEDVMFSKTVLEFIRILLDMLGQARLEEARSRARQAKPGFNRFTELPRADHA